jgi:hypothetical protein
LAIAALLFWLCTAAVGSYLLVTGARSADDRRTAQEQAAVPAEVGAAGQPAATAAAQAVPAEVGAVEVGAAEAVAVEAVAAVPERPEPPTRPQRPVRDKDRFDPPSLQRAKSEPLPGLRDLAEFTHPALAIIGFAFWLCYVISRDRLFAMIGLGVLLGAICAGLSWFAVNSRAARRATAGGPADSGAAPLIFPARLVALHAVGAVLTVLFATLIAAHV